MVLAKHHKPRLFKFKKSATYTIFSVKGSVRLCPKVGGMLWPSWLWMLSPDNAGRVKEYITRSFHKEQWCDTSPNPSWCTLASAYGINRWMLWSQLVLYLCILFEARSGETRHSFLIIAGHTRDDGWLLLSYSLNSIVDLQGVSSSSHW